MAMTNGNLTVLSVGVSLRVDSHRKRRRRRRKGQNFQPVDVKFVIITKKIMILEFEHRKLRLKFPSNFVLIRAVKAIVDFQKFSSTTWQP
jgi:hypothetical protein